MFSNTSKYAVKALVYLVQRSSEEHKILAKEISDACEIPKSFLSNILQILAQKDYISSAKGRNGGFYIAEKQLSSSLLDIIIEVEGIDRFSLCALNLENCDATNPCVIHDLIAKEKNALRMRFQKVLLQDLKNELFDT